MEPKYWVLDFPVATDDATCVPAHKQELIKLLAEQQGVIIGPDQLEYRTREGLIDSWVSFKDLLNKMITESLSEPNPPTNQLPARIYMVWPDDARTSWESFLSPFATHHNIAIGHFKERQLSPVRA